MMRLRPERPEWFDPYYDERLWRYNNQYRGLLLEHPDLILHPRVAEERRGLWCPDGRPLHVEIGSGDGDFLVGQAQKLPQARFVGVELRYKRVFKTAELLSKDGIGNVSVVRYDASFVDQLFDDGEVDCLYLFFPDPWPKKRHHKHRMITQERIDLWYRLLKPGSALEIKSDHQEYFNDILALIAPGDRFLVEARETDLEKNRAAAEHLTLTRFEKMFQNLHFPINYLRLRKK
jgi:tRNA (guanine-N7-)-methyltransferase